MTNAKQKKTVATTRTLNTAALKAVSGGFGVGVSASVGIGFGGCGCGCS